MELLLERSLNLAAYFTVFSNTLFNDHFSLIYVGNVKATFPKR